MYLLGIIMAILSGVLLVARNYYAKKLTNSGFKSFHLLLGYNFIGFIALSTYLIITFILDPSRQLPTYIPLPTIALYLLVYSISGYTYFYLIKKLPLSTMVPLFGSLPLFSAVTALLVIAETLHPFTYLGIGITSLGPILISYQAHRSRHEATNTTLLLLAFINLLLYAVQSVIQKQLIMALGVDLTLWVTYAGISLIYSPIIFRRLRRHKKYHNSYLTLFTYCLAGIGGLAAGFGSFRLIPIGVSIALANIALPLSILVGKRNFAEHHARAKLLGSLFIACGAVIITLFR